MKALVVDATINGIKASIKEMENLLNTLDIQIDFVCTQVLPKAHTTTYIGKGLLTQVGEYVKQNNIDIVVFNNDLTPLQIKNIYDVCGCEVYDRSMIILKIFERRANSKEAKLQVEIAYLKYMSTRLIDKDFNYDQVSSGGAGGLSNRGAGEKAINIKKFLIRKAIKQKEEELVEIALKRKLRRQKEEHIIPRVAIVGYTNAGKSTLMNNLIKKTSTNKKDEVLEENRLFATLTTNTRLIKTNGHYPFLLTDTVGFISDLPTSLIKAFRSTLEEITDADLLIQVVDISDPLFIEQMQVTKSTLLEIGVKDIPMLFIYNKIDKLPDDYVPFVDEDELLVSLKDDVYNDQILDLIDQHLSEFYVEISLFIPYEDSNVYFEIKNSEALEDVEENIDGYKVVAKISRRNLKKYHKYMLTKLK
jgi:GTP-binding protein HflX